MDSRLAKSTPFPYTTLFRSHPRSRGRAPQGPSRIPGNPRNRRAARLAHREGGEGCARGRAAADEVDRKSTRLNSSHTVISYAVFCLKKKNTDGPSSAAFLEA